MYLVISRKLSTSNGSPVGVTRETVMGAVNSGSSTQFTAPDKQTLDAYIANRTAMGFTCHVFEYASSFQSVSTVQNVQAA